MGDASPAGRDTANLLAGNALGTMFTELRFRGFVMTSEDIDTEVARGAVSFAVAEERDNGARRATYICLGL